MLYVTIITGCSDKINENGNVPYPVLYFTDKDLNFDIIMNKNVKNNIEKKKEIPSNNKIFSVGFSLQDFLCNQNLCFNFFMKNRVLPLVVAGRESIVVDVIAAGINGLLSMSTF